MHGPPDLGLYAPRESASSGSEGATTTASGGSTYEARRHAARAAAITATCDAQLPRKPRGEQTTSLAHGRVTACDQRATL